MIRAGVLVALTLTVSASAEAQERALDCVIEPSMVVKLASPVQGVLDEVAVDRGETVAKGQVVARLESGLEQASVAAARVRAASDVTILANQSAARFQEGRLKRNQQLAGSNFVTVALMEEIKRDEEQARLKIQEAKQDKQMAELELGRAEEALRRRSIASPIDGIVVDRYLSPGEFVYEQAPIMRIAKVDVLNVEAFVPVQRFGELKVGMRGAVRLQAPFGGSYEATLTVIDQILDAASGTFRVRLQLANRDRTIPAGARCALMF